MNDLDQQQCLEELDEAVPLCLHCLNPVDPLDTECVECGHAVGQLTPYLPWESINWQVRIWSRMWEQVWRRDVSLIGRVFRFGLIAWSVPVLLYGLIPMALRKFRGGRDAVQTLH